MLYEIAFSLLADPISFKNTDKEQVTFVMFHFVVGVPFDLNQNEFDGLTLWEQIDSGAHFTPTKKFLTSVPIVLYGFAS